MRKGAFETLSEIFGPEVINELLSQLIEYSPDDPLDDSEPSSQEFKESSSLVNPETHCETVSLKTDITDSRGRVPRNGRSKSLTKGSRHRSVSSRLASSLSIPEKIEEERTPEPRRGITRAQTENGQTLSERVRMANFSSDTYLNTTTSKPISLVPVEVHQAQTPEKSSSMEEGLNHRHQNEFFPSDSPSNPTSLLKSTDSAFTEVMSISGGDLTHSHGNLNENSREVIDQDPAVSLRKKKDRSQRARKSKGPTDSLSDRKRPHSMSQMSARSAHSVPGSTVSMPTDRSQFASMIELACGSLLQEDQVDGEDVTQITVDHHRSSSFYFSPQTGQLEPLFDIRKENMDGKFDEKNLSQDVAMMDRSRSVSTFYSGVVVFDLGCTCNTYICLLAGDIHHNHREQVLDITNNMTKRSSSLLLDNHQTFHSFGTRADEFYLDLHPEEADKWFYFPDIFKQVFSNQNTQGVHTVIEASNRHPFYLSMVLCQILNHLKHEISDYLSRERGRAIVEDLLWLIALPGITRETWIEEIFKQAAEMADISRIDATHKRLFIFMKPFSQSLWCNSMRVPEDCRIYSPVPSHISHPKLNTSREGGNDLVLYMNAGGEFLSFVLYQVSIGSDRMQEIYCSRELGCSGEDVTKNFILTLEQIFGTGILQLYRRKHPLGWLDFLKAFDSRKRVVTTIVKQYALHHNILLPFSFISFYERQSGMHVEHALREHGDKEIFWTNQGMIRITATRMRGFFQSILNRMRISLRQVLLHNPDVNSVILCGGFADSPMVQKAILDELDNKIELIVPDSPSLTAVRGMLLHGMRILSPQTPDLNSIYSPQSVSPKIQDPPTRTCSLYTFGVAIIKRFREDVDPPHKTVTFNGVLYCTALFDRLILVNEKLHRSSHITEKKIKGSTTAGVAIRHYRPAHPEDDNLIMTLYRTMSPTPEWVIEEGVEPCARLVFDLKQLPRHRNGYKTPDVVLETTFIFTEKKLVIQCVEVYSKVPVRVSIEWRSGCFYR